MVDITKLPGTVPVIGKDGTVVAYVDKSFAEKHNIEIKDEG